MVDNLAAITPVQIEDVERLTLRWMFQALADFGSQAYQVFADSPDKPNDVAEDITREVLDNLPGFNISQRILGAVDYKKARYIILPHQVIRQALFVDSKAERSFRNATLQMSQLSLRVKQRRAGDLVDIPGSLPTVLRANDRDFLTTTMFLHFYYVEVESKHQLCHATLCALPNGQLQEQYNPEADNGIWSAGRNAPTLGEDFRVRLDFGKLRAKAAWRVQVVEYAVQTGECHPTWQD